MVLLLVLVLLMVLLDVGEELGVVRVEIVLKLLEDATESQAHHLLTSR